MIGFLSIELSSGLIINGAKLMIGQAGKHWIALPAERQVDRDGNPKLDANGRQAWSPIVEFRDRDARDRFNELVLAALQRQQPEALS
jgi:DNA-binding cell septation regulator SpoVG